MTAQPDGDTRPRLFVAIELPEAWKQAFAAHEDELRRRLQGEAPGVRLRFVRPEGVHLTLKFLGETATSRLPAIEAALEQAVPRSPDLCLELGGVSSFGDRRAPRVVWAGVDDDVNALSDLVGRVETSLESAGFPRERRPFAPHLTIARLPDGLSQSESAVVLKAASEIALGRIDGVTVEQVSLMSSHLGPGRRPLRMRRPLPSFRRALNEIYRRRRAAL